MGGACLAPRLKGRTFREISVILLNDIDKVFSVLIAVAGVFVVTYGYSGWAKEMPRITQKMTPTQKTLGNIIIGIGIRVVTDGIDDYRWLGAIDYR
jgi:hypothetical protein